VTHVAHSDETHHNVGRYRGIAVVTAPLDIAATATTELKAVLEKASVREFKWHKLRTARNRFAALHVADWLFDNLDKVRADVLTWDTEDRRHCIQGRDDTANLHRMYHHVFKNVFIQRWPSGCVWRLHPDEQTSMNWQQVHEFLQRVSTTSHLQREIGETHRFSVVLKTKFRICQIVPCCSEAEPLIQLADLLAGLSAFSQTHFDQFQEWQSSSCGQDDLFGRSHAPYSRGEQEKFAVLSEFHLRCKQHGLGISLNSSRGLLTRNPKVHLNFWPYMSQHEDDKAPTRHVSRFE
jgi:hypothetical protein